MLTDGLSGVIEHYALIQLLIEIPSELTLPFNEIDQGNEDVATDLLLAFLHSGQTKVTSPLLTHYQLQILIRCLLSFSRSSLRHIASLTQQISSQLQLESLKYLTTSSQKQKVSLSLPLSPSSQDSVLMDPSPYLYIQLLDAVRGTLVNLHKTEYLLMSSARAVVRMGPNPLWDPAQALRLLTNLVFFLL